MKIYVDFFKISLEISLDKLLKLGMKSSSFGSSVPVVSIIIIICLDFFKISLDINLDEPLAMELNLPFIILQYQLPQRLFA